jgi:hypothetical protein
MCKHTSFVGALFLAAGVLAAPARADSNAANRKLAQEETERRVAAVYDQAAQTLVRIERDDGMLLGGESGVIVTAEGHVLFRATQGA